MAVATAQPQIRALAPSGGGREPGDFAVVITGRVPEWYTVLFGCMKAGVVSMPGTNLLTAHDIEYRVNHAKATLVVVAPEHCEKVDAIRGACPTLKHFIVVGGERDGWLSLEALLASASPTLDRAAFPATHASDMMMAYFTSGTTSRPKLVRHTQVSYPVGHLSTMYWIGLKPGDVHLNIS